MNKPEMFEVVDFFTPAHIELIKEIKANRELYNLLASLYTADPSEWPYIVGTSAGYVGIVMDDAFTPEMLEMIYPEISARLKHYRKHGGRLALAAKGSRRKRKVSKLNKKKSKRKK